MRFLQKVKAFWRVDTYQNANNDDAKLLIALLVANALELTRPVILKRIDNKTEAWRDNSEYIATPEPLGYSGSLEVGKRLTRMPDWLKDAAYQRIIHISEGEWQFVTLYLEKGIIQYRIEQVTFTC